MIKFKLKKIIINYSNILLNFFLKFDLKFFCALILYLNLRKFKNIPVNTIKKKIIVFSKSGGVEDIFFAYKDKNLDNSIAFYELPRIFIKTIFYQFIAQEKYADYYTYDYNENVKNNKLKYCLCIKEIFRYLDFFWKFDAVISFNIFYYAENNLPEAFQKIGKKFLVIHKESVNSPEESIINFEVYRDKNKKSLADKVAVYCENEKNILIDSNLLKPNQIEVIGCSRSGYSYELRDKKPSEKKIVYFMIETNRSNTEKMLKGELVNWANLAILTAEYLNEYAFRNPEAQIIFKGKKNVHTFQDLPKNHSKNCKFELGNPGHKFLKDAKVVICFNSTIMFEAILANRNIVIPNFGIDRTKLNKLIYKSPNCFADTKDIFFDMIDEYLKKKYQKRKFSNDEKDCVDFYLGNTDGKAGIRLKKFIEENLHH